MKRSAIYRNLYNFLIRQMDEFGEYFDAVFELCWSFGIEILSLIYRNKHKEDSYMMRSRIAIIIALRHLAERITEPAQFVKLDFLRAQRNAD